MKEKSFFDIDLRKKIVEDGATNWTSSSPAFPSASDSEVSDRDSTVVEHSPHYPNVKGLSLAVADAGREKVLIKVLKIVLNIINFGSQLSVSQ
jgi:hypothetical protein